MAAFSLGLIPDQPEQWDVERFLLHSRNWLMWLPPSAVCTLLRCSLYLLVCWHVWPSICLSVCLSLSIYLSIYLSVCLCLFIYLYIYLSICLSVSVYLSIYISIYLSVCLSVCLCLFIYLYIYLPTYLPTYLRMYVSVYLIFLFLLPVRGIQHTSACRSPRKLVQREWSRIAFGRYLAWILSVINCLSFLASLS
jgi:hypothetical protein